MNNTTILKLMVILSTLSACTWDVPKNLEPEDIWPIVVDVYSDEINHVTPKCEAWLINTRVMPDGVYVPGTSIMLSDLCKNDKGCHIVIDNRSYIWCKTSGVLGGVDICYGHEYLHALSYCMTGKRDAEHEIDGLWCNYGYLCEDMRGADIDSVEFQVNEILWGE